MKVSYYLVYKRGIDGRPEKSAHGSQPKHNTPENARQWLVNALGDGLADGEFDDYQLVPFDEAGQMLDLYSKEQVDRAREDALWLVQHNQQVKLALCGMIAGRQLYSMAATAASNTIENIPTVGDAGSEHDTHPMAFNLLGRVAMDAVAKGFDELSMLQGLAETVLPWVKSRIKEDVLAERINAVAEMEKQEKQRRAVPLPTGLAVEEFAALARDKPTVVIGYGMIVSWVLQKIRAAAAEKQMRGLHLTGELETQQESTSNLLLVKSEQWSGTARNSTTMERFFGKCLDKLAGPYDFVLVDNLRLISGTTVSGSTSGYTLAEVLRKVQKVTRELGCGLVCGLPTVGLDPYTTEFKDIADKLDEHANVARLQANVVGNNYEVVIDYKNTLSTILAPISEVRTGVLLTPEVHHAT